MIERCPETGIMISVVTPEYALAFQTLDLGYPLPVDLEMVLIDQGYNVEHLYDIFEM